MSISASEPIGSASAALHQLDAGDQGGGDGAEADGEDAEAPVGRLHGRGRVEWSRAGKAYGVVADAALAR